MAQVSLGECQPALKDHSSLIDAVFESDEKNLDELFALGRFQQVNRTLAVQPHCPKAKPGK
jgi:hypothetical protein